MYVLHGQAIAYLRRRGQMSFEHRWYDKFAEEIRWNSEPAPVPILQTRANKTLTGIKSEAPR
jgi:hypothetical protein